MFRFVCAMKPMGVSCVLALVACGSDGDDVAARCDSMAEGVELNLNMGDASSSATYSFESGGGNIALAYRYFGNDGLLAFIGEQLFPPASEQPAELVLRVPDAGSVESGWYCSDTALYTARETKVGPNAENLEFTAEDVRVLGKCPGRAVSGSLVFCDLALTTPCSQQTNLQGTIDGVEIGIDTVGLNAAGDVVALEGGGFIWIVAHGDAIVRGLIRLPSDSGPPMHICIGGGSYAFSGDSTFTGLSTLESCNAAPPAGKLEGCSVF